MPVAAEHEWAAECKIDAGQRRYDVYAGTYRSKGVRIRSMSTISPTEEQLAAIRGNQRVVLRDQAGNPTSTRVR